MENHIRVFLADDTLLAREGWKRILETDQEIEVVGEASSTVEALNKVKELETDVVLMDLRWGTDKTAGATAIREMKKMNDRTKIIAITAYEELIPEARSKGADVAILKDFTREQLLNHIHELYKGRYFDLRPDQLSGDSLGVLTPRELEVLNLIDEGLTDKQIADRLVITESTAKNHVRSLLDKLAANNRTHAIKIARERGMLK